MTVNRRTFLGSMASAAGCALPLARAGQDQKVAANDKLVIALIGCGGMGSSDLRD